MNLFASAFILVFISYLKLVIGKFQLQILHCNDLHSRFMETDIYSASCSDDFVKEKKCYGGFARLKEAAVEATAEAKKNNLSSIFLNAGDTFHGTPFYTQYKWKICAKLVSEMGFDVMTIGNHEFDDGIENLINFLKNVNTPTICSNLNLTSEPRLNLHTLTPSYMKAINGKKIAFIGYLTPDTVFISKTENLQIFPEIPYIKAEAKRLKAAGADIIIALGHSGFELDKKIAEEIEEISLVVGGHSHTFLYSPPDKPPSTEFAKSAYPTWVIQKSGKKVPVVQAYAYSKYLGKLLVEFDDKGNVETATGNPILLDGTVAEESSMLTAVSCWSKPILEKLQIVIGYTRTFLGRARFSEGLFGCTMCNLITDAIIDTGVMYSAQQKVDTWTIGPIAFYLQGGIRAQIDHKKNYGALTVEDLMITIPFNNKLVLLTLRGKTIRKILEFGVETCGQENVENCDQYFVHFSGLYVVYDLSKPPGERVKSAEVICTQCYLPTFVPLEDETAYQVFTVSYLANGGGKLDMIPKEQLNSTTLERIDYDVLTEYVKKNRIVYPILDKRLIVQGFH